MAPDQTHTNHWALGPRSQLSAQEIGLALRGQGSEEDQGSTASWLGMVEAGVGEEPQRDWKKSPVGMSMQKAAGWGSRAQQSVTLVISYSTGPGSNRIQVPGPNLRLSSFMSRSKSLPA